MKQMSRTEKSDILITLAMAFEKNFAASENRETISSAVKLAEKTVNYFIRRNFICRLQCAAFAERQN